MIDSIVFATDFSQASHNAGLYASALSMHFQTTLVVTHAFTLAQAALEVETEKPLSSQQRLNLNHDLKLTADVLASGRGATEAVLVEGDPCRAIPALVQTRYPALLILGTHGRGSIDRFVLGSTAEQILRHLLGPALTVGPSVNTLQRGKLKIRRILYATDCTPEAAHAAPFAVAFADAFTAHLDVLNVVHSRDRDHTDQLHRLQHHFYGAVEAVMPDGARRVCQPHTFVSMGKPHTDILAQIDEREIDLLILGLHRSTHLGMHNRTSGAFPIIVRARCPVITVASGSST